MAKPSKYDQGVEHDAAGRLEQAEHCFRAAILTRPKLADAHFRLATVLHRQGRLKPAIASYQTALRLQPNAAAHRGLGIAFERLEQFDKAESHFRQLLQADPGVAESHKLYGELMRTMGRLDIAMAAFDQALRIDPFYGDARFGRGFVRLLRGDLPGGWADYEFRRSEQEPLDPALAPRWQGENPAGRTLLLYGQQGIGDSIQFMRYAPMVAALGARVLLAVPTGIMALAQGLGAGIEIVPPADRLPRFDWSCPLTSLPFRFATTLDTIPGAPSLAAPVERLARWRARLPPADANFCVALSWAGNPRHPNDHRRSIPFEDALPLMDIPGVRTVVVQPGGVTEPQRRALAALGAALIDDVEDFADTAAILEATDLVVSVDTALCHLAGAMGRETWTLLPAAPDWRWLLKREDSPWYPSMRLFRQAGAGDWAAVVARVRREIAALAAARSRD